MWYFEVVVIICSRLRAALLLFQPNTASRPTAWGTVGHVVGT